MTECMPFKPTTTYYISFLCNTMQCNVYSHIHTDTTHSFVTPPPNPKLKLEEENLAWLSLPLPLLKFKPFTSQSSRVSDSSTPPLPASSRGCSSSPPPLFFFISNPKKNFFWIKKKKKKKQNKRHKHKHKSHCLIKQWQKHQEWELHGTMQSPFT